MRNNRGALDSTFIIVIVIGLGAILMFIYPLMTMADKQDDVSNLTVQTATTEFTNNVRTTGKLTQSAYDNFIMTLSATGNAYSVELTVQKLDENPAKKSSSDYTTIGDNIYYTMYTTQVLDALANTSVMNLNEGDIISVNVKLMNKTLANQLRNWLSSTSGNQAGTKVAESSGMVTKTAN